RVRLGDAMGTIENHLHFRERLRKNETIPTFHSPATRIFHVNRDDFGARLLREIDNPLAEDIGRSARSIGSDDNVAPAGNHFTHLPDRARAFARTGTAHGIESEALDEIGENGTVTTRTDQRRSAALRKITAKNEWEEKQPIMPECADVA